MIQVIVRAFDILEFVAQHGKEPVQLIKIADNAGLSQPTTANIVKTLVTKNYLEHVGRKEGYRIGVAAYQLTDNQAYDHDLVAASRQPLEELTKLLNETSLIGVIRNNQRHVLHLVESNQMLHVKTLMIGGVYDTSTGRLLMAYLPEKELQTLIKTIGLPKAENWPETQTREGLDKALAGIRKQGYAQIISAHHTVGFALPVYKNKQVIASVSVFVPLSRYNQEQKEKILKNLQKAARKIKDHMDKAAK
jgi:DNA-binding IclR family transcriptional regulator